MGTGNSCCPLTFNLVFAEVIDIHTLVQCTVDTKKKNRLISTLQVGKQPDLNKAPVKSLKTEIRLINPRTVTTVIVWLKHDRVWGHSIIRHPSSPGSGARVWVGRFVFTQKSTG